MKFKYHLFIIIFLFILFFTLIANADTTITDEELTTGGNITSDYVFANGSFMSGVCHSNGDNCSSSGTDTNETAFIGNLTQVNCPAGNYTFGIYSNGTVECRSDVSSADGDFDYNMTLAINNTEGWNVNFSNVEISQFYTPTSKWGYTIDDDGSNVLLDFPDVGGNNYVGITTTGGFMQLYANPNPSNDYLLFTVTETQGADTEINFYEGGTTHNRLWSSGSVRIGGDADNLCTAITADVDCDTPLTGADLIVQDDIWLGGEIWINQSRIYNGSGISWSLEELNTSFSEWHYNQSDGSFNQSYQDFAYNMTLDGDFDYNFTIGTLNQYGLWWYNQSEWTKHNGSTLTIANITNFDYNYNQTDGSFNQSYQDFAYNMTDGLGNHTASQNINITSYNYTFGNGGDIFHNGSCVIIQGATSVLCIN